MHGFSDTVADPALVTGWIIETQAERTRAEAELRMTQQTEPRRMSHSQIADLVRALGDIVAVPRDADPDDESRGLWSSCGDFAVNRAALGPQERRDADLHGSAARGWCRQYESRSP